MVTWVDTADDAVRARLLVGDEEALAEVFDRYGSLVYGLARRVVGDAAAAEDVVQEVFTWLWTHPDRFDPARGSLRAFLGIQAQRRAIDTVRSSVRRAAREGRHHDVDVPEPSSPGAEVEAAAVSAAVRDAIGRLPVEQREVVELAYFGGYTQRELASLLGIPEGTAKSRLRLAQSKLSSWLAPQMMELA